MRKLKSILFCLAFLATLFGVSDVAHAATHKSCVVVVIKRPDWTNVYWGAAETTNGVLNPGAAAGDWIVKGSGTLNKTNPSGAFFAQLAFKSTGPVAPDSTGYHNENVAITGQATFFDTTTGLRDTASFTSANIQSPSNDYFGNFSVSTVPYHGNILGVGLFQNAGYCDNPVPPVETL